jgi:hypothetical protein
MVAIEGVFRDLLRNRIRPIGPLPLFFFGPMRRPENFIKNLIFILHVIDFNHLIYLSDLPKNRSNSLFTKKKTLGSLDRIRSFA